MDSAGNAPVDIFWYDPSPVDKPWVDLGERFESGGPRVRQWQVMLADWVTLYKDDIVGPLPRVQITGRFTATERVLTRDWKRKYDRLPIAGQDDYRRPASSGVTESDWNFMKELLKAKGWNDNFLP